MKRVLAIILGGGKGSRLYPLTKMRAKPAVPLAGKYRLIDIPISNCINSGIEKIRKFAREVASSWIQIYANFEVSTAIAFNFSPEGFSLNSFIFPKSSVLIRPNPSAWPSSTGKAATVKSAPLSL